MFDISAAVDATSKTAPPPASFDSVCFTVSPKNVNLRSPARMFDQPNYGPPTTKSKPWLVVAFIFPAGDIELYSKSLIALGSPGKTLGLSAAAKIGLRP